MISLQSVASQAPHSLNRHLPGVACLCERLDPESLHRGAGQRGSPKLLHLFEGLDQGWVGDGDRHHSPREEGSPLQGHREHLHSHAWLRQIQGS